MKETKVIVSTLILYILIAINLATIYNTFKYELTINLAIIAIWLSYRAIKQAIKIITKITE